METITDVFWIQQWRIIFLIQTVCVNIAIYMMSWREAILFQSFK